MLSSAHSFSRLCHKSTWRGIRKSKAKRERERVREDQDKKTWRGGERMGEGGVKRVQQITRD